MSHSTKVGKFLSLTKNFVYLSSSSVTLPLGARFDSSDQLPQTDNNSCDTLHIFSSFFFQTN